MKTLILLCALFISDMAFAQANYNAAIRQAHNAVNKTEAASQGHEQPMLPPQSPPPAASHDASMLAATMQNIALLQKDFDAMSASLAPTSLINDLAAAAMGTKASAASVKKLADDLQTALGGNDKLNIQHRKLAQAIHAVFNSSQLTVVQQQNIENEVQKVLTDGGVPPGKISAVADDIKAVVNETK